MFSINFGWTGSNDGFYYLSNINPGGDTYNAQQMAVVGISPTYTSTSNIVSVPYEDVDGFMEENALHNISLPAQNHTLYVANGDTLIHLAGNEILLTNGFFAETGSYYEGTIDNTLAQVSDITNVSLSNVITPNGDGINDFLTLSAENANSWEFIVCNRLGNEVDHSAGYFTGTSIDIWDGGGLSDGSYSCYLRLKNNYGRQYENNYSVSIAGSPNKGANSDTTTVQNGAIIVIRNEMGVNQFDKEIKNTANGFTEDAIEKVSVSPNPFTSTIRVDFGNNENDNEIIVYDPTGNLILHKNCVGSNEFLGIKGPSGIYFIQTITKRQTNNFKILKQ